MKGARAAAVLTALVLGWAPAVQQATLPPGLVRAGVYREGPVVAPAAVVAGAVYDAGPFPLVTSGLAPGDGRDATAAMCSVCHSLRYITMQPPLPPQTWEATVRKMIAVHGAQIPEEVAGPIIAYLRARYGSVSSER